MRLFPIILTLILEVDLRLSFPLDFLYRLASTSDYKTSVLHQIMWYIYAFFVITLFKKVRIHTLMGIRISIVTGLEAFTTVFLSSVLTM